jgi:YesN/AraC family two-component response regulator
VEIARREYPCLIICDVMMPRLDGYGVLAALRQDPKTALIPFIFLTAKAARTDVRQGMAAGADDYLLKPCTAEELLNAVETRLKKHATYLQLLGGAPAPDARPLELQPVFDYIEKNFRASIGLREVAQAVGYSPAYLTEWVGRLTGKTVLTWIITYRLREACRLLRSTTLSIAEVAQAVGYADPSPFSRIFRREYGQSPQAWRKNQ